MGALRDLGFATVRVGLTAALSIAASAAPADPPPPAKLRIGDITFSYGAHSWRIVADGGGAVATCVQFDCRGVVLDIRQTPSDGSCTKDFVRETAERLFPMADRHAVNTFPAGRFGLTLSESRFGPAFGVATYVFGCLDWQGRHYTFTTRPETVGDKSWAGGALHYLISRASAPPARIDTLTIGDMTLDIPTDVWRVTISDPDQRALLICQPPTCNENTPPVIVSRQPGDAPTAELYELSVDTGRHEITTIGIAGGRPDSLAFEVTTIHLGCRNYVPATVIAIARRADATYRISSPTGPGCRSSWPVPDAVFMDLLRSARVKSGVP